jgi:chromosome segregation ATPase
MPTGQAKVRWAEFQNLTRTALEVAHSKVTSLTASVHEAAVTYRKLREAQTRLDADRVQLQAAEAQFALEEEPDSAPTDADIAYVEDLVGEIRAFREDAENYDTLLRLANRALSTYRDARDRAFRTAPPATKCANPATPHYYRRTAARRWPIRTGASAERPCRNAAVRRAC